MFLTSLSKSMLLAAITLTSMGTGLISPNFRISFCWSARSSLACNSKGKELISSKNSVPLWASSNFPIIPFCRAPVNAPPLYPKNSDSIRSLGIAAHDIATKGWSFRWLKLWIAWANSSLPVPLSPTIRTLEAFLAATLANLICSWSMPFLPLMSPNSYFA